MKQISTGTGLVVLSGTILASVFLSSPRTASTAFASAQQAQPAERGVGRNLGSNATMVADCQSTESLQWFSATPKEIQGGCPLGVVFPSTSPTINLLEADINNDGIGEYFIYNYENKIYLSTIETITGIATSKLILVFILDDQLINDYRSSVGLSSDGYWNVLGLRDCDNDGDMDLVIGCCGDTSMYFENTGFQYVAPLEGDLNHDGQVDNADVGVLLLHFDA